MNAKQTDIEIAIDHIMAASKILDNHANNPTAYNNIYSNELEIKSWELYKIGNSIKYTANRYGVA